MLWPSSWECNDYFKKTAKKTALVNYFIKKAFNWPSWKIPSRFIDFLSTVGYIRRNNFTGCFTTNPFWIIHNFFWVHWRSTTLSLTKCVHSACLEWQYYFSWLYYEQDVIPDTGGGGNYERLLCSSANVREGFVVNVRAEWFIPGCREIVNMKSETI